MDRNIYRQTSLIIEEKETNHPKANEIHAAMNHTGKNNASNANNTTKTLITESDTVKGIREKFEKEIAIFKLNTNSSNLKHSKSKFSPNNLRHNELNDHKETNTLIPGNQKNGSTSVTSTFFQNNAKIVLKSPVDVISVSGEKKIPLLKKYEIQINNDSVIAVESNLTNSSNGESFTSASMIRDKIQAYETKIGDNKNKSIERKKIPLESIKKDLKSSDIEIEYKNKNTNPLKITTQNDLTVDKVNDKEGNSKENLKIEINNAQIKKDNEAKSETTENKQLNTIQKNKDILFKISTYEKFVKEDNPTVFRENRKLVSQLFDGSSRTGVEPQIYLHVNAGLVKDTLPIYDESFRPKVKESNVKEIQKQFNKAIDSKESSKDGDTRKYNKIPGKLNFQKSVELKEKESFVEEQTSKKQINVPEVSNNMHKNEKNKDITSMIQMEISKNKTKIPKEEKLLAEVSSAKPNIMDLKKNDAMTDKMKVPNSNVAKSKKVNITFNNELKKRLSKIQIPEENILESFGDNSVSNSKDDALEISFNYKLKDYITADKITNQKLSKPEKAPEEVPNNVFVYKIGKETKEEQITDWCRVEEVVVKSKEELERERELQENKMNHIHRITENSSKNKVPLINSNTYIYKIGEKTEESKFKEGWTNVEDAIIKPIHDTERESLGNSFEEDDKHKNLNKFLQNHVNNVKTVNESMPNDMPHNYHISHSKKNKPGASRIRDTSRPAIPRDFKEHKDEISINGTEPEPDYD